MESRWRNRIVAVIFILLLIIMGLSAGGRSRITWVENIFGSALSPVEKGIASFSNFVSEKIDPLRNVWNYSQLNYELKEENQALKEELVELTLALKETDELDHLSNQLNYIRDNDISDYVTANVIAKDPGNWYSMFTIDVGSDDGLTKNSTVINGDGLVGLVYEVGYNWSKVIALIDHKSSVAFETLTVSDDYDGLIKGTIDFTLRGEFFDPQADIQVGEMIITSGLGIYPKGIIIGKITEIVPNDNKLLKEIVVEPAVNFKKINKVIVVPYEEIDYEK